jgi:hypothetical protein
LVNQLDPETLESLRDRLLARCVRVEELDRRTVVRLWRDWNAAYPVEAQRHRAICRSDIVSRLCAVQGSLWSRHALAAYRRQGPGAVLVLCVDALVGWRCRCARVPELHDLDANLIVTRPDFGWTFGTHELWKRGGMYGGPVFLEREMAVEEALHRGAHESSACLVAPVDLVPDPAWLAWNQGTVSQLARKIRQANAFEQFPVLADALEDAGCTDAALLGHLRAAGPHVRDCWALAVCLGGARPRGARR